MVKPGIGFSDAAVQKPVQPYGANLPSVLIGIGGSAGALGALFKVLANLRQLVLERVSFSIIIQFHAQQVVAAQQPDWLLGEVSTALGSLTESGPGSDTPCFKVEELPVLHAPIQPGGTRADSHRTCIFSRTPPPPPPF